jgi:hypothetical protein
MFTHDHGCIPPVLTAFEDRFRVRDPLRQLYASAVNLVFLCSWKALLRLFCPRNPPSTPAASQNVREASGLTRKRQQSVLSRKVSLTFHGCTRSRTVSDAYEAVCLDAERGNASPTRLMHQNNDETKR